MVVSLYVCDIPQNIEKEELESVFSCFDGFVEVRLAKDKNKQKIAFVDYDQEDQAKHAMHSAKGFRFASSTRGITVRYSENTKSNTPQPQAVHPVSKYPRRDQNQDKSGGGSGGNPRGGHNGQQQQRNQYGHQSHQKDSHSLNFSGSFQDHHSQQQPNTSQSQSYFQNSSKNMPPSSSVQQRMSQPPSQQQPNPQNMHPHSMSQQVNPVSSVYHDQRSLQQPPQPDFSSNAYPVNVGNDSTNSQSHQSLQPELFPMSLNPSANVQQLTSHPTSQPYQPQQTQGNPIDPLGLIRDMLSTPQQAQQPVKEVDYILQLLLNSQSLASGAQNPQNSLISNPLLMASLNQASSQSQKFSEAMSRVSTIFGPNIMPIPKNATNTVYVEGIPLDASEREVAHIFRPFPGFKSVRLIPREKKPGEKVIFCFADFENAFQTTLVINTLQGYRFDKDDILGLQYSYAITNNKYSASN